MIDTAGHTAYDYGRHARPATARQLRALGLDIAFDSGNGDRLRLASGPIDYPDVLDLVGGYGTSLFGHNHPELVAALHDGVAQSWPFASQGSVRLRAAELATRLSARISRTTDEHYVVTLGSTGADAVEAAMRHAMVARSRRLAELQDRLDRDLRRARRDGYASFVLASGSSVSRGGAAAEGCADGADDGGAATTADSVEGVLHAAIDTVARLRRCAPAFVSLAGAFHGHTVGAAAISDQGSVPADLHVPGPRRLRIDWRTTAPELIASEFDAELMAIDTIDVDQAGVPRRVTVTASTIAACFAEPIQGEAGVRTVPDVVLRALRELCDRHAAPLVFDEIQSGMGRTGTFLAAAPSGVRADYTLLAKSLGGGLAKISALLVPAAQAVDDFGRHHTSTFAEDDASAAVAVAALDLQARLEPRIAQVSARLGERLAAVVSRWPDVFTEVRGRGLMRAIELAPIVGVSKVLGELLDEVRLGYVVCGHLLHRHGIRLLPTLSASTTLRIQPSAYLSDADVERLGDALEATAEVIRSRDFSTLVGHLTIPPTSPWHPPRLRAVTARALTPPPDRPDDPVRVAFLAMLNSPADLRGLVPEFAGLSDPQLTNLMARFPGEVGPLEVARAAVVSPTGPQVEVMMIAVPLTSSQVLDMQRAGRGAFLRSTVIDAVELAAQSSARVVGLGGYTSVVTGAGRDVVEDRLRVTTGNALTAACVLDQLGEHLQDLTRRDVAVVGALGNIGIATAQLLADRVDSLTLVGTHGSASRLHRLRESLDAEIPVRITEDLTVVADASVVVSATNAARPVIDRSLLATDRRVVVCDLAIPGDVAPSVADAPNVTLVAGGRTLLPLGQEVEVPASGLPRGVVFSCLAETILLGFEPTTLSPSYGPLSAQNIQRARELAARHGFRPVLRSEARCSA